MEPLVSCLIYGNSNVCDNVISFIELLQKYTEPTNIRFWAKKITGAMIRIMNYRWDVDKKEKMLRLVLGFNAVNAPLSCFVQPLQSTYLKLIAEFPREKGQFL